MQNYLKEVLHGNSTNIFWGKRKIQDIKMNRGVKQGDPVSPWMFNSVMDELLEILLYRLGVHIGEYYISAIAYADDLVCRMALNDTKCMSLSIEAAGAYKKVAVVVIPVFKVNGKSMT